MITISHSTQEWPQSLNLAKLFSVTQFETAHSLSLNLRMTSVSLAKSGEIIVSHSIWDSQYFIQFEKDHFHSIRKWNDCSPHSLKKKHSLSFNLSLIWKCGLSLNLRNTPVTQFEKKQNKKETIFCHVIQESFVLSKWKKKNLLGNVRHRKWCTQFS